MHPYIHAQQTPDKPAYLMAGSGETVSYRQLNDRSNQAAQLLRSLGLKPGDAIALCLETGPRYSEIAWAAHRCGLIYVPVSTKLLADEIAYIVNDCGARAVFVSASIGPAGEQLRQRAPQVQHWLSVDGSLPGYADYLAERERQPARPVADETAGLDMLYSSGTTGRPKGIKARLERTAIDAEHPILGLLRGLYGMDRNTVYLSPAPLYHGAPLRFTMGLMRVGGTSIIMEKFDAEQALALIERHRITHAQFVPTMFVRMLKLPAEVRRRYDLSSLRIVIHAAAPCPVSVKEQMIEWLGPIVYEYCGASEGHGQTAIDSREWLAHKGSVGKPVFGRFHIVGDDGVEQPTGEVGTIWVEGGGDFEYHNDPQKTGESTDARGWRTVGDMGYIDEDGYVYLTDRKANMIISGGVNIYPQETEDLLIGHPKLLDAAVFGVPNEDFGEEVKAVVQPVDMNSAGPELEQELIAWCRERLSPLKCPRSIDFAAEFPRHPNGKLYKRRLRDRYWEGRGSRIV